MLGAPVSVTAAGVTELVELVRSALGLSITVTQVRMVGQGANSAQHFAIETGEGHVIGLKAVTRGIPEGEAKETTISDLAVRLDVPNACRVVCTPGPKEVALLKGRPVAVTHWLTPSENLSNLPQADIPRLRQSQSLLRQLGLWIAFGVLFGVKDRGLANWAVDVNTERLAMIDNEASFEAPDPGEFRGVVDYFGLDRPRLRSQKRAYVDAVPLISGMEAMVQGYLDDLAGVQIILRSRAFSAQFTPLYSNSTPTLAADDIIDRLG